MSQQYPAEGTVTEGNLFGNELVTLVKPTLDAADSTVNGGSSYTYIGTSKIRQVGQINLQHADASSVLLAEKLAKLQNRPYIFLIKERWD